VSKDESGNLVLNMDTRWRSRDLYKAWCDNVVPSPSCSRSGAQDRGEDRNSHASGSYADYSTSLHIYGQDFSTHPGGYAKRVRTSSSDSRGEIRAESSRAKREELCHPAARELGARMSWHFTPASKNILDDLLEGLRSGDTSVGRHRYPEVDSPQGKPICCSSLSTVNCRLLTPLLRDGPSTVERVRASRPAASVDLEPSAAAPVFR